MQSVETNSEIKDEAQYKAALNTLGKRSRPPKLLRLLMQGLEAYRGSRRIGWSRPHNKYGVTTFCTFKLSSHDLDIKDPALCIATSEIRGLSSARKDYLQDLVSDPSLMGFCFFQDFEEKGDDGERRRFETATLSLGRVVPGAPRFRDRFDLLLDAPIKDNRVDALGRVRVVVDPYVEHTPSTHVLPPSDHARALLDRLASDYQAHRKDEAKLWNHWTQDYIDYFGPRQTPILGTRFPTEIDDAYAGLLDMEPDRALNGAA